MRRRYASVVLNVAVRHMTPFLMLYAVYVLVHGHYGPGGGFQAGALLGLAVVLVQFVRWGGSEFRVGMGIGLVLACTGALIYLAIGLASFLWGGNFLDYGVLPIADTPEQARSLGILGIEAGVTLGVMGVIIIMFDLLTRGGERE